MLRSVDLDATEVHVGSRRVVVGGGQTVPNLVVDVLAGCVMQAASFRRRLDDLAADVAESCSFRRSVQPLVLTLVQSRRVVCEMWAGQSDECSARLPPSVLTLAVWGAICGLAFWIWEWFSTLTCLAGFCCPFSPADGCRSLRASVVTAFGFRLRGREAGRVATFGG